MAYSITLAGQDITSHCQLMSIKIDDTLGQGTGAGASAQGRATTFEVLTDLGPVGNAIGAGQSISGGVKLVRGGEIKVTDNNGNRVFGGYLSKLTDNTDLGQNYCTIDAVDYSTSLQRITVNEVYSAMSDIAMFRDLVKKYAPWLDTSRLPTSAVYTFPVKRFRNVSLEQALQTIAQTTGYQFWVDFKKGVYYQPPTLADTAPFALSDKPDFIHSFPHWIEEYIVDDNAIVNRVTLYGGKTPTTDYTQDASYAANGTNKDFVFAHYPQGIAKDNKIHVLKNGVEMVVGSMMSQNGQKANIFKSKGGLADVLVDTDGRVAQFDVAPAAGSTITLKYRFQNPLVVQVGDKKSQSYFGAIYDATISDETIFDTTTAVQRCKVLLLQQAYGLIEIKVHCYKPGIQAGMTLNLLNSKRGINATYVVQQVETTPIGPGIFDYCCTLGAWNWNLVDVVLKLAQKSNTTDPFTDEATTVVQIQQALHNHSAQHVVTRRVANYGGYFVRNSALNDGHDGYVGLFSITT